MFIITGIDLAQLVVKAIMLLEDAGLQVVALTCDGASTNKTMLKILNVTGNKTEFKILLMRIKKFMYFLIPHM